MNRTCRILATSAVVLALPVVQLLADDKDLPPPVRSDSDQIATLGVAVEELPDWVGTHLPDVVARGQGILVEDVEADSPAAKGGLRPHDILLSYDDQKLFVPEQLVKLVHGDKPGREVKLGIVRKGKLQNLQVTLGSENMGEEAPPRWLSGRLHHHPFMQMTQHAQPQANEQTWTSFDSMTLKKLDKNRFQASIQSTDEQGKPHKHQFEGTREELRQKIADDKDLTPDEREHLLRSLELDTRGMMPPWLGLQHQPSGF